MSSALRTVPLVVTVMLPEGVRTVPAGTPVFVGPGQLGGGGVSVGLGVGVAIGVGVGVGVAVAVGVGEGVGLGVTVG
jgi:hypothetical protein